MSNPTIKNVVIELPNKIAFKTLTLEQKNENIEYVANLLADELDLVIFDDLTIDDPTYGKIFFLGFENHSCATFCLYYSRNGFTTATNSTFCFEFVDSNNDPVTDISNYNRTAASSYGIVWSITSSSLSYQYGSGFSYIKDNNMFYLLNFASSSYGSKSSLFDNLNAGKNTNNAFKFGCFKDNSQLFRFIFNASSLYFIDLYPRSGSSWALPSIDYKIIYSLLGDSNEYYTEKACIAYTNNNLYLELPSKFKHLITDTTTYNSGTILYINDKYYLVLYGYSNNVRLLFELTGSPNN